MPDISMCKGNNCNIKGNCYRFKANPNDFRQSWFCESPNIDDLNCDYYWEIIKPIHKLNGGKGATLCNNCSKIINTGFTNELYCSKKCEIMTKLERIEKVIKYYYDRGANKERVNKIKHKILKYEATLSTKK